MPEGDERWDLFNRKSKLDRWEKSEILSAFTHLMTYQDECIYFLHWDKDSLLHFSPLSSSHSRTSHFLRYYCSFISSPRLKVHAGYDIFKWFLTKVKEVFFLT